METTAVQYPTTSDGYNIAHCVTGSGRPFMLMPEPFNHLHMIASSPTHRSLLEPLAERFRLVQYDPRGFRLSSRGLRANHTIRDNIIDLEGVVDRLGLERFVLYGPYFYGTTAADYAPGATPSAPTAARPLADGPSSREAEVPRLLAMGKSNAQIADELS